MGNKGILPTLSTDGFISQGNMLMSKLFEYFLSSDYSQSNFFIGEIKSLKYILSKNNKPMDISREIEKDLINLYSSYYTDVIVNCAVDKINESKYKLLIEITGKRDGSSYNLTKELKTTGDKIDNFESELDILYKYYGYQNTEGETNGS